MKKLLSRFEQKTRREREVILEAIYLLFVQLANIDF